MVSTKRAETFSYFCFLDSVWHIEAHRVDTVAWEQELVILIIDFF